MIGNIGADCDITVYVEKNEIDLLADNTLEGVIIKTQKPKQQGKLSLSISDSRSKEYGCELGVVDTGYHYDAVGKIEIFVAKGLYEKLKENGVVSLRQGILDASKVTLLDRSKLDSSDTWIVEYLEFYRDNKDKLRVLNEGE